MREQLAFPGFPEPTSRPRVFRMRLLEARDGNRRWECRVCDRIEEKHYDRHPTAAYREPCAYCNDPASPLPECKGCGEVLPRRGPRRCAKCARKARADVFRARWLAAHPPAPVEPLFHVEHLTTPERA